MLHCSLDKSKKASPRISPLLQKLAIELLSFAEWSSMQLEVHRWSLAKRTAEQQRENLTNRTRRSWMKISILAKPLTIWCWAVLNFGASSTTASFVLVKAASMSTTRFGHQKTCGVKHTMHSKPTFRSSVSSACSTVMTAFSSKLKSTHTL